MSAPVRQPLARRVTRWIHLALLHTYPPAFGRELGPNDPVFFMHHAQIDRIWAIWQRNHPGVANYNNNNISVGQGHGPNDHMWPWDAGASAPGASPFSGPDPGVAAAHVPTEAANDLVTPANVLDPESLGYVYGD